MEIIKSVALVLLVIAALSIIVLVLLQQGKGADAGAAFGAGSSGSVFGSAGSANFLSRSTSWMATVFIVCTVFLSFAPMGVNSGGSALSGVVAPASDATAPASGAAASDATPKEQAPAKPADNIPK
ncbi:MAG: preprotein translocase subunit SecG [Formosimonas sp.]